MRKEQLHSYLKDNHRGKSGTISGAALAQAMGISGNELRRLINILRREGVPIASGSRGYYYAVNAGEVYTSINSLKKMECGIKAAIAGLECAMTNFSQVEQP